MEAVKNTDGSASSDVTARDAFGDTVPSQPSHTAITSAQDVMN